MFKPEDIKAEILDLTEKIKILQLVLAKYERGDGYRSLLKESRHNYNPVAPFRPRKPSGGSTGVTRYFMLFFSEKPGAKAGDFTEWMFEKKLFTDLSRKTLQNRTHSALNNKIRQGSIDRDPEGGIHLTDKGKKEVLHYKAMTSSRPQSSKLRAPKSKR